MINWIGLKLSDGLVTVVAESFVNCQGLGNHAMGYLSGQLIGMAIKFSFGIG
ncbi:MAG: hypothetical protein ACL7AY_11320 [Candidatus Arsenophonus phytopathogenicus]